MLVTAALFLSTIITGWYVHPATISSPPVLQRVALLPTLFHNLRVIVFLSAGGLLLARSSQLWPTIHSGGSLFLSMDCRNWQASSAVQSLD